MNLIKVNAIPSAFNRADNIIDSFFNNYHYDASNYWGPNYDVENSENEYKIFIDVPGVEKSMLNIECYEKKLSITGDRGLEQVNGKFSKEFNIPDDVVEKDISAKLKNGVLELALPRKAKAKAKKIAIK